MTDTQPMGTTLEQRYTSPGAPRRKRPHGTGADKVILRRQGFGISKKRGNSTASLRQTTPEFRRLPGPGTAVDHWWQLRGGVGHLGPARHIDVHDEALWSAVPIVASLGNAHQAS